MHLLSYTLSICLLVLLGSNSSAQVPALGLPAAPTSGPGCLTDELRHRAEQLSPLSAMRRAEVDNTARAWVVDHPASGSQRSVLTIAVVVHIIHNGGAENITDAQVLQGIQDMNDAFANAGPFAEPEGVEVGIHFCLAQRDPNDLPTTGITRTVSSLTNVISETQDLQLKDLIRWPATSYLNIWLVREITSQSAGASVAGYAYFPSAHGQPQDGIVNEARWFGSSTDNSKVHIHEAGHYLGLYHTFEGGCTNYDCLVDGDRVCDTPPDGSSGSVPCSMTVNTCGTDADDPSVNNPFRPVALGGSGDQPDLFRNYLDYGLQPCQDLFTAGQADRMNAMLSTARASLLNSNGCDIPCAGLVQVYFPLPQSVVTNVATQFTNESSLSVAVTYAWSVDGVLVASSEDLTWTFTTTGEHTVALSVTNTAEGCSSEIIRTLHVGCNAEAAFEMTPSAPMPGEEVTFVSTGQGITPQWFVDGLLVGSGSPFNAGAFTEAGGHSIRLVMQGGGCADTSSTAFLPVGACVSGANNTLIGAGGNIISFNGDEPLASVAPTSYMGFEGVSTASDVNGELVLYTDGIQVFNGAHQLIANNLMGGGSSTQAALIVPKPGSTSVYYIFTTDDWVSSGGGSMTYSEVDLSLNGGAGGMVQTNVVIAPNIGEQLAAVRGCNAQDIWVIAMDRTSSLFHAFHVTSAGVDTTPVDSDPSFEHGPSLGAMKGSPKGDKLAVAFRDGAPESVMLFDFNSALGVVTNPVMLAPTPEGQQYGVVFSSDGTKLYVSNADDGGVTHYNTIYQFDLISGIPETMRASRVLVGSSNCPGPVGAMQRVRNGRIYVTLSTAAALGEIQAPNAAGPACGFVDFAVPLQRPLYGFGLSNMVPLLEEQAQPSITGPREVCAHSGPITYKASCTGLDVQLQHNGVSTVLSSPGGNTITLDIQEPGTDTLIVLFDNICTGQYRDTILIHVGAPMLALGNDTTICSTGEVQLDMGPNGVAWTWQNSAGDTLGTDRRLMVTAPGTFVATVTGAGGCTSADTITVSTFPNTFQFSLGPDVMVCAGPSTPVTIQAPSVDAVAYEWINGNTSNSITVNSFWYNVWLTITNSDGCRWRDTVNVIQVAPGNFAIDLGPDRTACPGQIHTLDAGACVGCGYLWQDGSTERYYTAFNTGTYNVMVTLPCNAQATDAVTISPAAGPTVDLGDDVMLCPFVPFPLTAGGPDLTYSWEDGSTGATRIVNTPGLYAVTAMNDVGCSTTDSLEVSTCTGILGLGAAVGFNVHPNPANDQVRITITGDAGRAVELLDARGRVVASVPVQRDRAGGSALLDVSGLASGVYAVRVLGDGMDGTVQVIVTH